MAINFQLKSPGGVSANAQGLSGRMYESDSSGIITVTVPGDVLPLINAGWKQV